MFTHTLEYFSENLQLFKRTNENTQFYVYRLCQGMCFGCPGKSTSLAQAHSVLRIQLDPFPGLTRFSEQEVNRWAGRGHGAEERGRGTTGDGKQRQQGKEGQLQNYTWEKEEDKIGDEGEKGLRQGRVAWCWIWT